MTRMLLCLALLLPFTANADIINNVRDFGLLGGTWKQDCEAKASSTNENAVFYIQDGTIWIKDMGPIGLHYYEVVMARQIDASNIHMVVELTGDLPVDVTINKNGNAIRTMESRELTGVGRITIMGGKNLDGKDTKTLTRCQ